MAQSLAQVLIHIIFTTHHRQPWIKDEVRDELHAYIGGILKKFDSPALTIGSVEDHVHIFGAELVASLQDSMIFSRLHTRGCTPGSSIAPPGGSIPWGSSVKMRLLLAGSVFWRCIGSP